MEYEYLDFMQTQSPHMLIRLQIYYFGMAVDVEERQISHARQHAFCVLSHQGHHQGPGKYTPQWLHERATEHGITHLHTVPLLYTDSPSLAYLEICESSFIVAECSLNVGPTRTSHAHIAALAKPSGSRRVENMVGANRELSINRPALKPHERGQCEEKFNTYQQLTNHCSVLGHDKTKKVGYKKRGYVCDLCPDVKFDWRYGLLAHIASTHNDGSQIFTCPEDGCTFFTGWKPNLTKHTNNVHCEGVHVCTRKHLGCEFSFCSAANLQVRLLHPHPRVRLTICGSTSYAANTARWRRSRQRRTSFVGSAAEVA